MGVRRAGRRSLPGDEVASHHQRGRAEFVAGTVQASGVSADPDDDKYLAAVAGRASVVVTGDPHLLTVREYEGVRVITPPSILDLFA